MKKSIIILSLLLVLSLISCSSGSTDTPKGMQKASGDDVDYNFFVPDDWTVETSTGVTTAKYSDSILVNVSLMAASLTDKSQTPDDYFNEYTESFGKLYDNWNLEQSEDTLLDGHAAKKFVYSGTVTNVEAKYMQVVCIKDGIAYIFTYTAAPDKYDSYSDAAEKMIDNFVFKD